ncbi:MAG: hypothetical protein RIS70_4387 [Planctomycetota bacterium]|jgi:hypothetical protein
MKRIVSTIVIAAVLGVAGMPRSADAGIFGRRFVCRSPRPEIVTTVAPDAGATVDSGRRYSYEPEARVRRTAPDGVPFGQRHLLPKTDPRRFMPD